MCPQADEGGREYWSYSMIRNIEPGDVVFHQTECRRRRLDRGGKAENFRFDWVPHGTYAAQTPRLGSRDQPGASRFGILGRLTSPSRLRES